MGKNWENRHKDKHLRSAAAASIKVTLSAWLRENRTAVLKVLPLGAFLPMVIFFGSVGPDDVAKNYAGWATKFGLTDFANTLAIYATGPRVFLTVVIVTFVYVGVAFIIPAIIRQSQKDKAVIIVPIGVALIVAIVVYGQYVISAPAERHISEAQRAKLKELISPVETSFPRALTVLAAQTDPEAYGYLAARIAGVSHFLNGLLATIGPILVSLYAAHLLLAASEIFSPPAKVAFAVAIFTAGPMLGAFGGYLAQLRQSQIEAMLAEDVSASDQSAAEFGIR